MAQREARSSVVMTEEEVKACLRKARAKAERDELGQRLDELAYSKTARKRFAFGGVPGWR